MSLRTYLDWAFMSRRRLNRRFFPWLAAHFLEFWLWYVGAFLSLWALHRLQTQLPAEVKDLTDAAGKVGKLPHAPVLTFILIAIGILVFRTLSRLLFFTPARFQQKLLRTELLELMEEAPPARYASWNDGQLYQTLFNDLNNLRGFVGFALLQLGNVVVAAMVMVPRLNAADPGLWVAFTPLAGAVLLFSVLTAVFQKYAKRTIDAQGQVQNHVMESYNARATVKNYHREETFIRRFSELSAHELALFFRSSVGFAFSVPMIRLGLGASLLWGAWLLRVRGAGTSELVFFAGYLFLMLEPLMFLSWMAVVATQGYAAWKRVKDLHGKLMTPLPEEAQWSSGVRHQEGVWDFTLPYWERELQFQLRVGQWGVLCGATGSGKSELLRKMASRLRQADHQVSLVTQEPYLFNDSIRGNIFLGRTPTPEDEALASRYLVLFGLDILTHDAAGLLALEVGENGKRLSGGQAKRLALVRSLMSEAAIFLWDDPFSSVDILLERKIIHSLRSETHLQNRTFIMTSHRMTTVRACDRFWLIKPATGIMAQGSPKEAQGELSDFFREQLVELPAP